MSTAVHPVKKNNGSKEIIHTTLYDLIAAINSEVTPEEDHLVVATVMHLLQTGRVKFAPEAAYVN
jgi:hypothetical protein